MSETSRAILEEAMYVAIDAGRESAARAAGGDVFAQGEVAAYYNVLDVIKEQAALAGVEFSDPALTAFDPDELLRPQRQTA